MKLIEVVRPSEFSPTRDVIIRFEIVVRVTSSLERRGREPARWANVSLELELKLQGD